MKAFIRHFLPFIIMLYGCSAQLMGSGFSKVQLRIEGRIIAYRVTDANGDGRNDFLIVSLHRGKPIVCVFLQSWSGFSSDPNQQFALPDDLVGIDLAQLGGSQAKDILLLTPSGVSSIPFVGGRFAPEKMRQVSAGDFSGIDPSYRACPLPLFLQGYGDSKNHLLLPREGAFVLYTQDKAGKFVETNSIHGSSRLPLFAPVSVHTDPGKWMPNGVFLLDINRDGKPDLCSVHSRGCTYFLQSADGSFPEIATASVAFSDAAVGSLAAIGDGNGDGIPDLFFTGESKTNFLANKKTTVSVYVGRSEGERIIYRSQPDHQWRFTGVHLYTRFVDYNTDGLMDLIVAKASYSLGNLVTSLVGSKTKLQIEFYRWMRDKFTDTPESIRETTLPGRIYDEIEPTPIFAFGDVTGDGRKDFILGEESAIFSYPGTVGRLFETTGTNEASFTPAAVGEIAFHRIDGDLKEDMCFFESKQSATILHIFLSR